MADLGTLALGTYTDVSSTAKQGTDPVLEVIASLDDADYAYDATNSTHTGSCYFELADMPSNFGTMATLSVRLRYHWAAGTQTNTWDTLAARVFKSDGSTALTAQATVASSITTTTATNSSVINFTGVDTAATKTDWDGARVYVYWTISKVKGGDTVQKRVTAGEITGTYNVAAVTRPIVGAAAGTATAAGTVDVGKKLAGATTGTSTASATIEVGLKVQGTGTGVSTAAATVTATSTRSIVGAADGTSTAAAALNVVGNSRVAGTAGGDSTASATLDVGLKVAGTGTGTGTASATLDVGLKVVAAADAVTTALATLDVGLRLAAAADGVSTAAAVLTNTAPSGPVTNSIAGSAAGTGTAGVGLFNSRVFPETVSLLQTLTVSVPAPKILAATVYLITTVTDTMEMT